MNINFIIVSMVAISLPIQASEMEPRHISSSINSDHLYIQMCKNNLCEIGKMDTKTSSYKTIISSPDSSYMLPNISRDGNILVYSKFSYQDGRIQIGQSSLEIADANGGNRRVLVEGSGRALIFPTIDATEGKIYAFSGMPRTNASTPATNYVLISVSVEGERKIQQIGPLIFYEPGEIFALKSEIVLRATPYSSAGKKFKTIHTPSRMIKIEKRDNPIFLDIEAPEDITASTVNSKGTILVGMTNGGPSKKPGYRRDVYEIVNGDYKRLTYQDFQDIRSIAANRQEEFYVIAKEGFRDKLSVFQIIMNGGNAAIKPISINK